MKKVKLICILSCIMSLFVFAGCGNAENTQGKTSTKAPAETTDQAEEAPQQLMQKDAESTHMEQSKSDIEIAIGTTGFIIRVPSDYYGADVTEEERRDDMIAYYKSDEHLMDFDVYQFPKEGDTLEEYAAKEAQQYGAESFEKVVLGDGNIDAVLYYSEEEYDGVKYRVANYIFETTTEFGELAFWLDGDDAEGMVKDIMSTLTYTGTGYDMVGKIVDKLPEDEYYNHYNVKGDNDEIYICNYNGEGELEEGTWVYMYMIDDGMYNIEVAHDIKSTGE